MARIKVNFSGENTVFIKPLHGINNSPIALYEPRKELAEAGIPYSRLHDTAGVFGGTRYVDIPNVFPDFNADPADPNSYDFSFTDAYIKQLTAAGVQPFYRLGVTIENNYRIKAYHIHPPADFGKWAEICAGIARHYNHGWANGFHYGIQYWEIWNEPENPPMWTGTREQFFELYKTASLRLRKEFPEIRIGGYAGCGFYAVNRSGMSDFYKGFVTWFNEFLSFVKENQLPFDFYSWHLYTNDPKEIILHAEYVDSRLKDFGFENVENIFNEWNYISEDKENAWDLMKEAPGAAFVAAAFCLMQKSPIDKAMYYDALPTRAYCGLYYFPSQKVTKTYYSFKAFNLLYKLGQEAETMVDGAENVYVCGAVNGSKGALFVVNRNKEEKAVELETPVPASAVYLIDWNHAFAKVEIGVQTILPPESVMLFCFGGSEEMFESFGKNAETHKFGGLG